MIFNIRIDEERKKRIEEICENLAITPTAYVNMALKKLEDENGVPFDLKVTKKVGVDMAKAVILTRKKFEIEDENVDYDRILEIVMEKRNNE